MKDIENTGDESSEPCLCYKPDTVGHKYCDQSKCQWGPNYDLELAFLEIYLYDSWTCSHVQKIYALISYLPMSTIKKPNISEKKIESLPKTQIFLSLYHWNLINLILK